MVEFNDRRVPRTISQRYPMLFDSSTDSPEEHQPTGASHPVEFTERPSTGLTLRGRRFYSEGGTTRDRGPWCRDCEDYHW